MNLSKAPFSKPLLQHPAAWLLGIAFGFAGLDLFAQEAFARSPQELGRLFLLLTALIGPPLVSWMTWRALAPEHEHDELTVASRPLGSRWALKLLTVWLWATVMSLGGLAGALLGVAKPWIGHLQPSLVFGYLLSGMITLGFWVSFAALLCSASTSGLPVLGGASSLALGLWLVPPLLLEGLQWAQAAPMILHFLPFSPLYAVSPLVLSTPLLPWGPVPAWWGFNRLWLVGLALLALSASLVLQAHRTNRRSPPAAKAVGLLGGLATLTAAWGIAVSWTDTVAPYTVTELLKGKATLDHPYTFDAYGRILTLNGAFGTLFLDLRPPQAPLPESFGPQERLLRRRLLGFLPPAQPRMPAELQAPYERLSGWVHRAFWTSNRVYPVPDHLRTGLVPTPQLEMTTDFFLPLEDAGGWLVSEGFLRRLPSLSPDDLLRWSAVKALTDVLPFNEVGRFYAGLYVLEPSFPERVAAFVRLLARKVELQRLAFPETWQPHYLPPYSPPTPEQRERFEQAFPELTAEVVQESDIPLKLYQYLPSILRTTASPRPWVEQMQTQLAVPQDRAQAVFDALMQRWITSSEGAESGLALSDAPWQRKAVVELEERFALSPEEAQAALTIFQDYLNTPMAFVPPEGQRLPAQAEMAALERQLEAALSRGLGLYGDWLLLQYWEQGEAMGHVAFIRSELARAAAGQGESK